MSQPTRTAFAGSFASGVVVSPIARASDRLPDRPLVREFDSASDREAFDDERICASRAIEARWSVFED